jgi:hypothetical protein
VVVRRGAGQQQRGHAGPIQMLLHTASRGLLKAKREALGAPRAIVGRRGAGSVSALSTAVRRRLLRWSPRCCCCC